MELLGRVWKDEDSRFWLVEVPELDLVTQGETKSDALNMIRSAIEELVNAKDFVVKVEPTSDGKFFVSANETTQLVALMLRRRRVASGITVREAAKRMGSKSPNAYSQYERGTKSPTIETFATLMRVLSPKGEHIVLSSKYTGRRSFKKA